MQRMAGQLNEGEVVVLHDCECRSQGQAAAEWAVARAATLQGLHPGFRISVWLACSSLLLCTDLHSQHLHVSTGTFR